VECGVEFRLGRSQIATPNDDLGKQLVCNSDVLVGFVVRRGCEQPPGVLLSLFWISLREPVFCLTGLEPYVVTPAEPLVAGEDSFDVAEGRKRLLAFARKRVITAEVD